jgi:hypothetical protein
VKITPTLVAAPSGYARFATFCNRASVFGFRPNPEMEFTEGRKGSEEQEFSARSGCERDYAAASRNSFLLRSLGYLL